MNINHLFYFSEVCKQENITKAAEICHVSQPSVTAAIKELESELGIKLFHRVNNRIYLTEDGRRFASLTGQFLTDYQNFSTASHDLAHMQNSVVRLGIPSVLGTFLLQKIIPDFQNMYSDISLEIYEVPTLSGIDMLSNAQLDFLIGINTEKQYSSCCSEHIYDTDLEFAVNANHPLSRKKYISPSMLINEPFVLISKGSFHYQAVTEHFTDSSLNVILQSSQLSTIEYMVENGYASTIIYRDIFSSNPNIRCIPLKKPITACVDLFYQKNTYLSAAMKKFISYIKKLDF